MTDTTTSQPTYRLGDPIPLHDFLALPPDGQRYARDEQGRLALMSPDDYMMHRFPLGDLTRILGRALDLSWKVNTEPGIAFDPIYSLAGKPLPASRLGRKALVPDLAVWEGYPRVVHGRPGAKWSVALPERLRLVAELLSPGTARQDLGLGEADAVDRWRTYLEGGVPEFWLLNPGRERCVLPPRSALFLANAGGAWKPLEGEDLVHLDEQVRGLHPVSAGKVRSRALPGLVLDLDDLWREADALQPD